MRAAVRLAVRTIAHSGVKPSKVEGTMNQQDREPPPPGVVVRTAIWVGTAFGRWQRQRAAARDDSFVEKWKSAWNEGCAAQRAGKTETQVPYVRSPGKDAWLAGWRWAQGAGAADKR